MRRDLRVAVFGLALGYVLSWMGFADYDEMIAMFSLESPRLWLAFALSVGVAAIGFRYDRRAAPRRPLHHGIVPGSMIFGVGWAITGTCPGSALTQLGEGQLPTACRFGSSSRATVACSESWGRAQSQQDLRSRH